jgi:hypothetical protein
MEILLDVVRGFMAMSSIVLSTFGMNDIALFIAFAGVCICIAILIINNIGNNDLFPPK